jgi:hypothetical protein
VASLALTMAVRFRDARSYVWEIRWGFLDEWNSHVLRL